ncbi:hypothetical protein [Burkholderia sp. 3C]
MNGYKIPPQVTFGARGGCRILAGVSLVRENELHRFVRRLLGLLRQFLNTPGASCRYFSSRVDHTITFD